MSSEVTDYRQLVAYYTQQVAYKVISDARSCHLSSITFMVLLMMIMDNNIEIICTFSDFPAIARAEEHQWPARIEEN